MLGFFFVFLKNMSSKKINGTFWKNFRKYSKILGNFKIVSKKFFQWLTLQQYYKNLR